MTKPAQVATFLAAVWCTSLAVPTGNHTCTGITKIPVTVLVNVTVPVTFRSYTWCLRVPPRCSKYTVQLRDRVQLHTEMHNKTITVCCRGYVEMDGKCVPACPEGADCPFMHCNRTNHCYCTPGYTGLYCNDPCPRGVWGRDCKRPCDCPTGYTCHHLTGDCMVDDRPSRKSTTTTEAPTTTKPPTTTVITTEATTLETVKTPQFRFPPPPWVEAAGTTTSKKLTTRIIRDEVTTLAAQTKAEEITRVTTPMTTVARTIKPIELVTPPVFVASTTPAPTIVQSTTVYIKTEKTEEYLPAQTTERIPVTTTVTTPPPTIPETTTPTTIPTSTLTTPKMATPTTPATSPAAPVEIITIPFTIPSTSTTTVATTVVTTPTTTTMPSTTTTTVIPTTERTTPSITESTTLATTIPNTSLYTLLQTTPSTTTIQTTLPTTKSQTTPPITTLQATPPPTIKTTPSTTTLQTTPSTTTLLTTPSTTTIQTSPSTTTKQTTPTTSQTTPSTTTLQTTASSTKQQSLPQTTTTEPVKITQVYLDTFQVETKPTQPVVQISSNLFTTSTPTPTFHKEHIEKPTISPEFKVIKVIKTDNAPKQKYPTFLEAEINPSTDSIPKEPFFINIKTNTHQRAKVKDDGSPIIYISPTSKENHEIFTSKESPAVKVSGTTVLVPSIINVTQIKKLDGNTVENEIHMKETTSTSESTQENTTSVTLESTHQQSNRSLMHSLFSGPKVPVNIPEETLTSNEDQEKKETVATVGQMFSEESKLTTPIHKKKMKDYLQKKSDEKSEIKKTTLETTTTVISPIHILKQLLNASSITTTTILPISENLPPNLDDLDDFTKEMINKKSKYDDVINYYLELEKAKKKLEKEKLDKAKHAKEGKNAIVTPIKSEKMPEATLSTLTTTSTTEITEKQTSTTQGVLITSEKPVVNVNLEQTSTNPVKPIVEQLTTTHSPNRIIQITTTTPSIAKAKDHVRSDNEIRRITTEAVTDNNNIVESNTIDTLHTSFEAMKKGLDADQEDSNYSIIHNKMRFVKSETDYGAAGMTGYLRDNSSFTGMLLTLGVALVTLLALAGTLWVYMRRRERNMAHHRPPIMAYELEEPTPIDVQSLEQTFFCPTFTNNYAAKINRELREFNYDHPRSSPPEPLYAEIRY